VGGREQRARETVLDIGSNAGYFLSRLAQMGYCVHGIERDPDLVYFTNAVALVSDCQRMSCECAILDDEFLARKSKFDIVLNFSVMHHVILHEGLETATRVLTNLAKLTRKEMYLEMGHSGEKSDWASRLPDMGSDPEDWIACWLKASGFSIVEKIGESKTTVPRPLFRCRHDQG
jgi:SAM-dependent methyltransferase